MPLDDRTTNRSYKLPNAANLLTDDVGRLRDALSAIDADVALRPTQTQVNALITSLINGAPGALDTLQELAAALGNDPNFSSTIFTALSNRYTKAESDARYVQGVSQIENTFTGNGTQTSFTLSQAAASKESVLLSVGGVIQPTANYSVTGTTLTLSEAPAAGVNIRALLLGVMGPVISAATLTFAQTGTGAVTRTVESKLRDVVSVKDFGAVGDGVTDDTAAIQAAINAVLPRGCLFFPEGIYPVNGPFVVDTTGSSALLELIGVGGAGGGSVIRAKAGVSNASLFTFIDSTCTVSNLSFEVSGAVNATALEFRGGSNNGYEAVHNCFFSGWYSAVTIKTDTYKIANCYAIDCTNFIIGANWAMNGSITSNYVLGGQTSVWLKQDRTDPSPQQPEGVRITDNTFLNTADIAKSIRVECGLEILIAGNIIDQTGLGGVGVSLDPAASGDAISYVKICDNWIDAGAGSTGACVSGNSTLAGTDVSRVWIKGNTFRGGSYATNVIAKPTIYLNSVNTYWILDNSLLTPTTVTAVVTPGCYNGLILGNHSRVTTPEPSLETNTWNRSHNYATTYTLSVEGQQIQSVDASGVMLYKSAAGGQIKFFTYNGNPENLVTANPGSICLRTDTGTLYVKQGTGTGATGWVAK